MIRMKKIVIILLFLLSFLTFSANNEAMINYIIKSSGGKTSRSDAQKIVNTVNRVSSQYNFPPAYIYGIIEAESNFRNLPANRADARGVMQVTPGTSAAQVGCTGNLYNIEYNIECGVKYFDWMRKNASHYGIKNLSDLAAAYNCGPGCFKSGRWKNVSETTNYIKKVPAYGNKIASTAGLSPLDMTQFPAGTGGTVSGNNIKTASANSSLMVDWDAVQSEIAGMINDGISKLAPGLLVLLSVLTVLEIMWILYGYIVKNVLENLWMSLLRIMIRFLILAYVIPNAISLIDMGYGIFSGIGSYFMGNSGGTVTLNSIWAIAGRETGKILKIINESNFNFFNIITDSKLFFEELGKMLLLIGVIILVYYFVVRIIFEMMMAVLQFRMALGLSWVFLPFDVNSITKRDLGNKALTTLFLTGSKIVVIMALGGIVFKNLDMAGFGEVTFKELKYETIFLFITVGMVMAFVMNEADKITTTLARGN